MRILEINKFNFPKGGADRHYLDVCELLEKNGHQVAQFSMEHSKNEPSAWSGYFVSRVGYNKNDSTLFQKIVGIGRFFYSPEVKRKINQLMDDFQPEVVHIHNAYHQLSISTLLAEIKKRNIPVVMTVHDFASVCPNYNLWHNGAFYNRCKGGRFFQCILDRCVRNSLLGSIIGSLEGYWHRIKRTYDLVDVFISPSLFVKEILVNWGMSENKIVVLPHFLGSEKEQKELCVQVKNPYAFYAGRVSREKGVNVLARIFEQNNNIGLKIAGASELGYQIKSSKNVIYLGYRLKSEIHELIQNSAVVVSGSRLPETFGLVALEAIAEGKPFVGFRTGAYGEIIENGVNGYLVDTEDEFADIIKKIGNSEIVFDSEQIAKSALDRFSSKDYLRQLEVIFRHP